MTTPNNELAWKVADLERRVRAIEDLKPEVMAATQARLVQEVQELKETMKEDMGSLKEAVVRLYFAAFALVATLASTAVALFLR